MARTRHIRPGFFTNETLGKLPPGVRLLFAGLWTIADREGRLEDRPVKIQAAVLPYDHIKVDKALADLATAGFISRYTVGDKPYIQILTWRKHQRPHPREDASVIPAEGSTQVNHEAGPEGEPGVNHEGEPRSGPGPSRTSSSRTRTRTLVLDHPQTPSASVAEGAAPPDGVPEVSTNGSTTGACCVLSEVTGGQQHSESCQGAARS